MVGSPTTMSPALNGRRRPETVLADGMGPSVAAVVGLLDLLAIVTAPIELEGRVEPMPGEIEYYNDELFNSLLVPGQCRDCGADVGLTDVPAWTFCKSCARAGGDLSALRRAAAA